VLNRPSDLDLLDLLPEWSGLATVPRVVFVGGPVEPSQAISLARADPGRAVAAWRPLVGDIGTLDLDRSPQEVGPGLVELRVFAGYAGWGGGQLDGEIAAGAWFVVDADPADVFATEPEALWSAVLGRQEGVTAWFARYPDDPSSN
jgi:putative transcriptional regulator